ncbi:MAG TPA: glycosyltransferase family 39 protein [Gaiellaceae bacterium]|nr:glycosyltransferase family 39 protein [Gaiellaceae bacterium]
MRWAVICVAALWLGGVLIVQQPGCSENGHYALVRSLADGAPSIDRYHWWTCDVSYYQGHFYTAKGPGLAAAALPALYIVRAVSNVGHVPAWNGPPLSPAPKRAIWPLEAMVVLTSGILLFLFMRFLAEAVVPGVGTLVAFVLTAGTMLLPYSTLFASHVPSAMLGTAAFVLLFRERRAPAASSRTLVAAGVLAGASIVVERPMGLVTVALIGYTLVRGRDWQRPLAYLGGALVGVLPLLIFDHWAFGSIAHTPYSDTVSISGDTGHDQLGANQNGFFGIAVPSLNVAARLLLLNKGLFVATPIVLAGLAGLWWLLKESAFRAEAWLITVLGIAYLIYNAAYYQPYGGDSAGPRFLIPLLPFVALPQLLDLLAKESIPATFFALGS